jgi:hypothetical protein
MKHVRLNSTTLSTITPAVPPAIFGAGISTGLRLASPLAAASKGCSCRTRRSTAEALYYDLGRSTLNQNFPQTLLPTVLAIPISRTAAQTT